MDCRENLGPAVLEVTSVVFAGLRYPFLVGVPYLGLVLGAMGQPNDIATLMALGFTPFILGGVIKAVIAAGLTPLAWRAVHALDAKKKGD
jgi:Uncharacterized conserved protein